MIISLVFTFIHWLIMSAVSGVVALASPKRKSFHTELKIYRVNGEAPNGCTSLKDIVDKHNITVGIDGSIIKQVFFYTGILAPRSTVWIDVTFNDDTPTKVYLICGHYAGLKTLNMAFEMGLPIKLDGFGYESKGPVLPCQEEISEHVFTVKPIPEQELHKRAAPRFGKSL